LNHFGTLLSTGQVGLGVTSLTAESDWADYAGLAGSIAGFIPVVGTAISTATDLVIDGFAVAEACTK